MKKNIIDSINELLVKLEDDSGSLSSALTKAFVLKTVKFDLFLPYFPPRLVFCRIGRIGFRLLVGRPGHFSLRLELLCGR